MFPQVFIFGQVFSRWDGPAMVTCSKFDRMLEVAVAAFHPFKPPTVSLDDAYGFSHLGHESSATRLGDSIAW